MTPLKMLLAVSVLCVLTLGLGFDSYQGGRFTENDSDSDSDGESAFALTDRSPPSLTSIVFNVS